MYLILERIVNFRFDLNRVGDGLLRYGDSEGDPSDDGVADRQRGDNRTGGAVGLSDSDGVLSAVGNEYLRHVARLSLPCDGGYYGALWGDVQAVLACPPFNGCHHVFDDRFGGEVQHLAGDVLQLVVGQVHALVHQ